MHHMSVTSHGTSILEPFWGGERGTSALYKRMKQRYQIPNVLGYFLGCPLLVTRLHSCSPESHISQWMSHLITRLHSCSPSSYFDTFQ